MKISIDYVFRKKNLFFFIIFFLFFSSFFLSSERPSSLFLTPDSNVNAGACREELPLVHNVYIFFTFFCFLATVFFFAFFLKEKKEDSFTFENVPSDEVKFTLKQKKTISKKLIENENP